MSITGAQLKQIIKEELKKILALNEALAIQGGTTLDAAKSLADWLKSKGFENVKAFARPAKRNYTLNKPPLKGGSIEPSTVVEFYPKSKENLSTEEHIADVKQQRQDAWELMKSEIGPSKKYKQSDNQIIEYIPSGDFIFILDYTGLPRNYRIGVLTKKITGLKNKVEDSL